MSAIPEAPPSADAAIAEAVTAAVKRALDPEKIAKAVETAADSAITRAISDAFSYSSDFSKQLVGVVKQIVPMTQVGDLATFSHAVQCVVRGRLENLAAETAKKHVDEVLHRLLPDDPLIYIDDFKKAFEDKLRQDIRDEELCRCDDEDGIEIPDYTWLVRRSTSIDRYWNLYISEEERGTIYGSKVLNLAFREIEGSPDLSECYAVNNVTQENSSLFAGPLYGFDAMIFRLGAGLAKLSTAKKPKAE